MPDENKLRALEAVGFTLKDVCGACEHFRPGRARPWGTCRVTTYSHGKHSGADREASVPDSGWCPRFYAAGAVLVDLARSGFNRFRHDESATP